MNATSAPSAPKQENSSKALGLYRVMEELFALDSSMPVSQALILMFVASKADNRGVSVTEVAEALDVDLARASRNLKMLAEQGLIDQHRDPVEYRTKMNKLSNKGARFIDRCAAFL